MKLHTTKDTKGTIMTSAYVKINHTLPAEVKATFLEFGDDLGKRNDYIYLLRQNEWSLQSIADVVGFTRERIRQICSQYEKAPNSSGLSLPTPPLKPVRQKRVLPEPDPSEIKTLLSLQPKVQKVRSNSPQFRKEAEEYSALIFKIYSQDGVSLFRLAKYLGVTHGALRFRMARYGYIKNKGKSTSSCYKPIAKSNRYILNA